MARPFSRFPFLCTKPGEAGISRNHLARSGDFFRPAWANSPGPKIILSQQAFEFYDSSSSSVNTPGVRPSLPILHAAAEEFL